MRTVNLPGTAGKNGATATPIIRAGSGPALIQNLDSTFGCFLSFNNSIDTVTLENAIPLNPGGTVVVDGENDVFGIGNFGTGTIQIAILPGGVSFFRPASLAALGGISVFIQASAPTQPPTIPVGSLWLQTTAGVVTGFFTWNGSLWVQQQFNASGILAIGTIIANLIAAGTIFAGIVDGTTIKAASFVGGNYFGYTGANPAAGTLSVSVVPGTANVTDSVGNIALAGLTSYQTPLAVNTIALNTQQGIIQWLVWNGAGWGVGAGVDWTVPNNFLEVINTPFRSISGTRANPTLIATDGRTNFGAFNTGFQAGSPAPWQAMEPTAVGGTQDIVIGGQILTSAATAANATMVTLFAAPAVQQDWMVPNNISGYTAPARTVRVDSAGNLRLLAAAGAANQFVIIDGIRITMG